MRLFDLWSLSCNMQEERKRQVKIFYNYTSMCPYKACFCFCNVALNSLVMAKMGCDLLKTDRTTVYVVGFNFMIAFVQEMKSILKCKFMKNCNSTWGISVALILQ